MGTEFFQTVAASLPDELAQSLLKSSESREASLDILIRFICGAEFPQTTSLLDKESRESWLERQSKARKGLDELINSSEGGLNKRPRDTDEDSHSTKRQKTSADAAASALASNPDDPPSFKLHAISTTSPVRKKVDITIGESFVKLTHPTTSAIESVVPLSSLKRAFILPTRGKQKPHWTVVIIASDTTERGPKATKNAAGSQAQTNLQIIFGIDAISTSPLTTTEYTSSEPSVKATKKGSDTLPTIRDFLAHLPIPVFEPSTAVFKSNCGPNNAGSTGVPGLEAYLGAKPGTLWFFNEGILWGEAKPCEFWAVEDLLAKNGGEAIRVVTATGRMCSLTLTRKAEKRAEEDSDDEEEDIGEETQFGMIDAREQDGINRWVKERRHLFGKDPGSAAEPSPQKKKDKQENGASSSHPRTILQMDDGSDESDLDFKADSDGESSGQSSDGSSSDGETDDGSEDGADSDDEDGDGDGDDVKEEELDEKHHPLLRPGAMPRMSRAAIDMVVGMVEDDMMGASSRDEEGSGEEDELDD